MSWSDKYIGLEYEFGVNDCIRLIENIYREERNFYVKGDNMPVEKEWYVNNPERLIKEAVERGEVINDMKQLREFDAVFFKIKNIIRHIGVMIDNHGHFVHQLEKRTSRVDSLEARHWRKRFYCAVRPKFTKQI